MQISIQDARIIDPYNQFDQTTNLYIKNNKIIALNQAPDGFVADKIIDANNKLLIPGLIDLYANIQDSTGRAKKEELNAAFANGITKIVCPPDGQPLLDTPTAVDRLMHSSQSSPIQLYPIGALTEHLSGEQITDLNALLESGCVFFSNGLKPIKDLQILRNCYDYAKSFNLKIFIKANETSLGESGVMHEGAVSARLGLKGIPEIAETIAISQQLLLIEQTGVTAHFNAISSQKGVDLIQKAQEQGLPVTADTAMHHLHLTEMDVLDFNTNCHLFPPLRSQTDRLGLQKGVKNGALSAICSHHRPLSLLCKQAPFAESKRGLSALDTFLSLGLHLVDNKILDLATLIHRLTKGPSDILGLENNGLQVGEIANFCIVDPNTRWQVKANTLKSLGLNTPFMNWDLPGVIEYTFANGQLLSNSR